MRWIPRRVVLVALTLLAWCSPSAGGAQTDSLSSFPSNASLAYPPWLQDDRAPQRLESSVEDRRERYAPSTAKKVALVPVRLLQLPFWLLNYPFEHWLIRRHPPAFIQRRLAAAQLLLHSGWGVRYGGFGVGSGIGGGVSYRSRVLGTDHLYAQSFAGVTLYGYQQYYVQLDRRFGTRTALRGRVQFRDQPRIEFYGIGLHSDPANHSSYRNLSSSVNLSGQTGFAGRSFFGYSLGYEHIDARRGLTPGIPSSTEIYAPGQIEGLHEDYDLVRVGLILGLEGRDNRFYPRRGTYAYGAVQLTDGIGTHSDIAYTSWFMEVQQFVPLPGARRTLAMRLYGVINDNQASGGRGIPVWDLQQLGGGHSVRAIPNFRYADEDLLVGNFEYRFPFWFLETANGLAIDALTFFDVGTVLPSLEKLQQKHLRSAAGFGFRLVTNHNALLKLDIGWSSEHFKIDAGVRGPL